MFCGKKLQGFIKNANLLETLESEKSDFTEKNETTYSLSTFLGWHYSVLNIFANESVSGGFSEVIFS